MKIVIGGQLRKQEIKKVINELDPNILVDIKTDMNGAMLIKANKYDLYLGSCDTGGGGALALAIALLGVDKTATIATQSAKKTFQEIKEYINNGVVAFGFVESEYEYATKNIIKAWKEKNE